MVLDLLLYWVLFGRYESNERAMIAEQPNPKAMLETQRHGFGGRVSRARRFRCRLKMRHTPCAPEFDSTEKVWRGLLKRYR